MKKNRQAGIILGIIFLSAAAFGQARGQGSNKIEGGKKIAKTYFDLMVNVASTNVNYGSANSSLTDYKKSANGIQAGVSLQAGITSGFSLVSELYYMTKGGQLKANNPMSANESTLQFNTLELPVLARFHMGKFYINAGPSIAYNISGNSKINDQSTKLLFENSSEGFKRLEAGIQLGGGVEFPFKQKRIVLDIRYNYGLTNIVYTKEMYNRALMISVHYSKAWKTNPLAGR
ncbi:porin family protein [Spirosoma pollinicola]|uniref:PorT family protein n=1 Tax=Spirosoma pollinicola TaxID=2057025 RepID=A0A2K8YWQ7_9BACT|nr:porin family protein [Spirosoma pollinicola]AUD02062.1 PorT family protein [Spirosoma pollinicola]